MSTQYKSAADVPTDVLCKRLEELSDAIKKANMLEFYMRIPAEVDHDADFVLAEAARRLNELDTKLRQYTHASELIVHELINESDVHQPERG